MADVLCLGEILVDWVSTAVGVELEDCLTFTKAAGGAPANTAVGLARQGISTGFIGRVSNDCFGLWLRSILQSADIDIQGTIVDSDSQTRMAYVVTTKTGDRKLAEFTRVACADSRLSPEDIKPQMFVDSVILHFGSISLISDSSSKATREAIKLARLNNMLISYDPNLRLALWSSPEVLRVTVLETLSLADIVKINEDELLFMTGSNTNESADNFRKEFDIPLLIITKDKSGAYFSHTGGGYSLNGFEIKLVEATGAGDGFNAGILSALLPIVKESLNRRQALCNLTKTDILNIGKRANAIGALVCTKPGAIPALPTKLELEHFMSSMKETNLT